MIQVFCLGLLRPPGEQEHEDNISPDRTINSWLQSHR